MQSVNSEREPQPSEVEGTPLRSGEPDEKDKGRKRSRVNLMRIGMRSYRENEFTEYERGRGTLF